MLETIDKTQISYEEGLISKETLLLLNIDQDIFKDLVIRYHQYRTDRYHSRTSMIEEKQPTNRLDHWPNVIKQVDIIAGSFDSGREIDVAGIHDKDIV